MLPKVFNPCGYRVRPISDQYESNVSDQSKSRLDPPFRLHAEVPDILSFIQLRCGYPADMTRSCSPSENIAVDLVTPAHGPHPALVVHKQAPAETPRQGVEASGNSWRC